MLRLRDRRFVQNEALPATYLELGLKNTLTPEKAVDGTATNTRSSTATIMGYAEADNAGAAQKLLTIPANIPRFNGARFIASNNTWTNVFADGAAIPETTLIGGLIENARTNYGIRSIEFDNSAWTQTNGSHPITITPNSAVSPMGDMSSDKLEKTETGFDSRLQRTISITPGINTYSASVYIKKDADTSRFPEYSFRIEGGGGSVVELYVMLNTSTGASASRFQAGSGSYRVVDSGIYWRVCITLTSDSLNNLVVVKCVPAMGTVLGTANNAAVGSAYFWGAQVEIGAFSSSPIITTTAAVTRSADVLSYPATNLNAIEGGFYMEFTPTHAASGTIYLIGSYVDASNYTAILHDGTSWIFRKRIAGTNYDSTLTAAFNANQVYKIAATWGLNGSNLAISGQTGAPNSNATALQLGSTIQIGADGNGAGQPTAQIKNIKFYQKQLSTRLLQRMTG